MSLFIASPIYQGSPAPAVQSLVRASVELSSEVHVRYQTVWQCALVHVARQELLRLFLESSAERLLFLDSDIVFETADVRALMALDLKDGDMVSGVYTKRDESGTVIGHPLTDGIQRGVLLEMSHIGLGFALTSRETILRVVERFGDSCFEAGKAIGEDVAFCARLRELGGRVWLHQQVRLGHVGNYVFQVPK